MLTPTQILQLIKAHSKVFTTDDHEQLTNKGTLTHDELELALAQAESNIEDLQNASGGGGIKIYETQADLFIDDYTGDETISYVKSQNTFYKNVPDAVKTVYNANTSSQGTTWAIDQGIYFNSFPTIDTSKPLLYKGRLLLYIEDDIPTGLDQWTSIYDRDTDSYFLLILVSEDLTLEEVNSENIVSYDKLPFIKILDKGIQTEEIEYTPQIAS